MGDLLTRRSRREGPTPGPERATAGRRAPRPATTGMVEEFSRRLVTGWVAVPADAPPTRVTLHAGPLEVSATYATADAAMSGSQSALRDGDAEADADADADAPEVEHAGHELLHPWQVPMVPGPQDDRRNSRQQVRTFSFRVRGLWPYLRRGTKVEVRVGGRPLPIYRHGTYLSPPRNGRHKVEDLRRLLEQGYVLSQFGEVQLSKTRDVEWQRNVLRLYQRCRGLLAEDPGHDLFLVYGTLLGAVREGGWIGHDVDFDAAYVSKHRSGPDAARELQEIAFRLIGEGLHVECMATTLHVEDPEHPGDRIDIFHTYFDTDGRLRFPFGVAGTSRFTEADWHGVEEIGFSGGRALVPVAAEPLVAHLYGEDWHRPKPGFNWNLARTDSAPEAALSTQMRNEVYWADFWSRHGYGEPSTFCTFLETRPDTPAAVLDLGCGDGRDARAFALAGRSVLGLDQSAVAVEQASHRAREQGLEDRVRFRTCDLGDHDRLGAAMADARGLVREDDPRVLVYLRFLLHAVPEDVQERLLTTVAEHTRPGDVLAAEFRTDQDESRTHVHTRHYRRYQNAAVFLESVRGLGFEVEHSEERSGLSPYGEEDPVLCRVVARRV